MRSILFFLFVLLTTIQAVAQNKISLEDIFLKRTFSEKSIQEIRASKDGKYYTVIENGTRIVQYFYGTGKQAAVLFELKETENPPFQRFDNYEFSSDETKILFTTEMEQIYRHSFKASCFVWNSITKEMTPLSEMGKQQLATFSPDGERIAFVRNNNIFIKNLKFGTESQVTFDGSQNKIINGAPDWVYEEEFGFSKAFAWSPDNKFLAWQRFDESDVRAFNMTIFKGEKPPLEENALYPSLETFKYPKAGEKNSMVTIHVYNIATKTSITADTGREPDIYLPRVKWAPDGKNLAILRLNRRQDMLDVLFANPYTGDTRLLFTEKNKRFVDEDFLDKFIFLEDGRFVVTSERDGFSHLYLHDKNGFEILNLTPDNYDVTDYYGYDPLRKIFYYQAAGESPLRREVCFVSPDGKKKGKLSTMEGTNSALFSTNFNYYINTWTNSKTPALITLHDWNGKLIRVLEDNDALKQKLEEYLLSAKEFFNFTTSGNTQLNGWMIKPAGFDPTKRYPVLITQYSGPNSQSVTDSWGGISWNEYLAQEGFLVVCVDPRGTAARGEAFRKVTYMQLGKYESDDMVETAEFLAKLPYVDAKNIAIWGWSYGGFMTALSMSKGGELFKAGIAVAPVTDWRFYDNIYTERYMRTPEENKPGYDDNTPVLHAGDIKGRILLIHGSADDNVHLQNTMEFSEVLVQAGIPFDMAIYTNRNHGIRGGNTTMHLYRKMEEFLKEQLIGR